MPFKQPLKECSEGTEEQHELICNKRVRKSLEVQTTRLPWRYAWRCGGRGYRTSATASASSSERGGGLLLAVRHYIAFQLFVYKCVKKAPGAHNACCCRLVPFPYLCLNLEVGVRTLKQSGP